MNMKKGWVLRSDSLDLILSTLTYRRCDHLTLGQFLAVYPWVPPRISRVHSHFHKCEYHL